MKKKISKKNINLVSDFSYTFMASAVMNAVLQLIIYPIMTKLFGASYTGEVLYFVGIIYILPQAIGTSLNSARLVMRKRYDATNGDYNQLVICASVFSAIICGGIALSDSKTIGFIIAYAVFACIYALRMYAQVEYRLKLDFKGYFFYYALVSVGYLAGFGIFIVTKQWLFIFMTGEISALIYSFFRMDIFKKEPRMLPYRIILNGVGLLVFSTLIRDGVNQFDKVILKQILGTTAVTEYTTVAMIAKVVQMFVGPVNTLIMSYLTVRDKKMTVSTFKKYIAAGLLAGGILYCGCIIGTPIYIRLFYSDLYSSIIKYSLVVNLGLVISFIASLYMAVLLSQGKAELYTIIQTVWGISYIVLGYFLTIRLSIWGMGFTMLIVNIPKLISAIVFSSHVISQEEKRNILTE